MVSASITQPCFHEKSGRNHQDYFIMVYIPKNWNHYVNGKWHPVGVWTDTPDEELTQLRDCDQAYYRLEKQRYKENAIMYNKLVDLYMENPNRWFYIPAPYEWRDDGVMVPLMGVRFFKAVTKEEFASFFEHPHCKLVAEKAASYHMVPPFYPRGTDYTRAIDLWYWRARLCVVDRTLEVRNLRAFLRLPSGLFPNMQEEDERELSQAIASDAKNGTYIVKINSVTAYNSKKNGNLILRLEIEVYSDEARGYRDTLSFDTTREWSMRKLKEITHAIGTRWSTWEEFMENCKTAPWKQWMRLEWSFLKADLNFNGNFLGFTTPRNVTKDEVDEWR